VFLSQLHDRVRPPSRARVIESYRLERAEARSVAPAARQLLDRHTALEELELLPLVWRVVPSLWQRVVEAIVLLLGEWQVEVVGSLVIAPRPERDVHVDAVVRDYRRCCVVEPQELFTDGRAYRSCQLVACQRTRCQHRDTVRYRCQLALVDGYQRVGAHLGGDGRAERLAVDRQ